MDSLTIKFCDYQLYYVERNNPRFIINFTHEPTNRIEDMIPFWTGTMHWITRSRHATRHGSLMPHYHKALSEAIRFLLYQSLYFSLHHRFYPLISYQNYLSCSVWVWSLIPSINSPQVNGQNKNNRLATFLIKKLLNLKWA